MNGQPLRSGGKIAIVEERGLVILRIGNVSDADTGTIKCHVKNTVSEISREVQLQLTGEQISPKIHDKSKSVEINAGQSVEFFVKVSGAPSPTVTWSRKGMPLSSNELYQLRTEHDKHYLLIKKAVADVVGVYLVTVANTAGKAATEIELSIAGELSKVFSYPKSICVRILGLSTLFERPLRDTTVTQGRPLTLDCELHTRNGVPTVVW